MQTSQTYPLIIPGIFWFAMALAGCTHSPVAPYVTPVYNFSFNASGNYLDPVCFASTGTLWKKSLHWDFGDSSTSAEAAPCHTYTASGTYTITMVADQQPQFAVQKTVTVLQVSGTEYTGQMVKTWRCHHYLGRFMYSYFQTDTLADTTISVQMINHSLVCVGADTIPFLNYNLLPGKLLLFQKNTTPNSVGYNLHDVYFYPDLGQLGYSVNQYHSTNDQYTSY